MIYETLTPFIPRLGFSRWHIYGWYTVNHPIALIPVTYMTDTEFSVTSNTVFYDLDTLIILEPILPSSNSFCSYEKSLLSFYHVTNLFFLQPKTNDHIKFEIRPPCTSWSSSIFWFYPHIFHKTLCQWHFKLHLISQYSISTFFKRRKTVISLPSNPLSINYILRKNLFFSLQVVSQPVF